MRLSGRTGLLWAMWLVLVAYTACLAVPGDQPNALVTVWLPLLADWLPAGVCVLAVRRVGIRRREVLLAAAAVTSVAVGLTSVLAAHHTGPQGDPWLAYLGFLSFYPLMLAALAIVVRPHARGLVASVWLDYAVGSFGAAAVLAIVMHPVLESALAGSSPFATGMALGYPIGDLLLITGIAGFATLGGVRLGRRWGVLIVGLLIFGVGDVVYTLRGVEGVYVPFTPLDAGWPIGLALVALWVDSTDRRGPTTRGETSATMQTAALVVSVIATAAALGVLVIGARSPLPTPAVALTGATLVLAAVRTQVALGRLATMANLRRREAITDPLTGLPNRRALTNEVHSLLADHDRDRRWALLMLDLDKFKEVNDSLGHDAGDRLLVQVGARLRENLRDGDLLTRLGGDEFAILLYGADHEEAARVAVGLRGALARTFALEGITLHSGVSIGIALFPIDGPDLSSLLRKADIAMYKAKASGAGQHTYSATDDVDGAARLRTVEELRTAIATDQLLLYYQPKVDLRTGHAGDVEALVRWDHPTRGLLDPDAFLPLVEEAGLMAGMTRVVLELALDQAAAWHTQDRTLTIAVNLSASSLVDENLPERVAAMLNARRLPPSALQLEITEDFLMADRGRARAILTRVRESGVQISIDDFGTGYSSLSYLRDLPIDELKLDRSFVTPMADEARATTLVASAIDLAHSLGLRMVAEGVETQVAFAELRRLGCDQAQGYLLSRPVPADELELWLSDRDVTDESLTGELSGIRRPRDAT